MIEIRKVKKRFGDLEVLRSIDLEVDKAELLCLLGASGSGKSTLLQCINGLEPIQGGEIVVDGIKVHDAKTDINALRRRLGIVFQSYNAFPHLTAIENVALAPRVVAKRSRAEAASSPRSISTMSGSAASPTFSRRAFPAGNSNGSRSPGRSPWSRATCFSTR